MFDLVGAVLFVIYGVLIHSFSTILLNGILIGIQIYMLYKLKNAQNTITEDLDEAVE